jgi:ABC-type lipoprotein export system ATPase subunit
LINLITGATVPDEGEVRTFGESTVDIADGNEWLSSLDRFGIVTRRAVLLDTLSAAQNLALAFTLDVEPVPADVAAKVETLAAEARVPPAALSQPVRTLQPDALLRVHLARALALEPKILILEHPTAELGGNGGRHLAAVVAGIAKARGLTVLALTQDEEFARAVADRPLVLKAATGELVPVRKGWW